MARWDPFEDINTLRQEINRVMEDFLAGSSPRSREPGAMEPAIEVSQTPEAIIVKAQVPGVQQENLRLSVTDDTLTLKGELKEMASQEGEHFVQREFRYGTFARTIALPATVQAERATAQLKDGMLVVRIPKGGMVQEHDIPVEMAD